MCDHCEQVTSHKDYAGQITCVCSRDDKNSKKSKPNDSKDKGREPLGCCQIEGSRRDGSCCGAKNCLGTKEPDKCCKNKRSSSLSTNQKSNGNDNNTP